MAPATFGNAYSSAKHDGPVYARDFSFPNGRCTYSGLRKKMP